jgi:hypothetical protein
VARLDSISYNSRSIVPTIGAHTRATMSILPADPLQRYRLALFVGLVTAGISLVLVVCTNTITSPTTRLIMTWSIVVMCVGLFAEVHGSDDSPISDRSLLFFLVFLFVAPLAGSEIHPNTPALSGLSGTVLLIGCAGAAESSQRGAFGIRFLVVLWAVSGFGLTVAHWLDASFVQEIFSLAATKSYLDIRYLLTAAMVAYVACVGVVRSLADQLPPAPSLGLRPLPLAETTDGIMSAFVVPVAAVLHFLSKAVFWFLETVWHFAWGIRTYVSRAVRHIGKAFLDAVGDWRLADGIKDLLIYATAAVCLGRLAPAVSELATEYLRFASPSVIPNVQAFLILLTLTGYFALCFIAIVVLQLGVFFELDEAVSRRCIVNMTAMLLAFGISGALVYAIRTWTDLTLVGFDHLGLFSEAMLLLVGALSVYHLARAAGSQRMAPDR